MDLDNSINEKVSLKGDDKYLIEPHRIFKEPHQISNSVLKRLLEEVRNDVENNISAYNRTHNRHNRGR